MTRIPLLLALLATPAQSHDWYDPWCCNTRDCRPVEAGEVTVEPGQGYRVRVQHPNGAVTDELVPFSSRTIRPSQDGGVHVCIVHSNPVVRCLYVPTGV